MKLVWGLLVVALVAVADAAPKTVPTAVVLVIDRSGSMQGVKLDAAKQGAADAIAALADGDQVEVITFDSQVDVVVPMTKLGKDRKALVDGVGKVKAGGGTVIFEPLKKAFEDVVVTTATNLHVILMTDGEAPSDGIQALVDEMAQHRVTVSCIGIDGADRNLLQLITDAGGGRLYMVSDVKALPKIYAKEILAARTAR